MPKFKVGDKVRVVDGGRHLNTDKRFMEAYAPNLLHKWRNGKYYNTMGRTQNVIGTVVAVGEIDKVLVSDASGELFVIYEYGLSLEQPCREFIVIHRSGNVMTAEHRVNREVIKSAKATCAPSDTFDFDTGAKLAFDRLIGREEPKPAPAPEPPKFYTGKVVCVEWKGDVFRHTNAGRIAMITNGISDYSGWNRMSKPFESFSDFCSANNFGVFHEIKE